MALVMDVSTREFALREPFVITGYTFTSQKVIWVTLVDGSHRGRGEATGIYYLDETPESMIEALEAVRTEVESGATRDVLQKLLPAGGARNALDCALWDLEAKRAGRNIWDLLGVEPTPLHTVATIGIGTAAEMAEKAHGYRDFSKLKVKLDAHTPIEKLEAVREARPDADLVIDVNQGWSRDILIEALPELARLNVSMIEQPLPRGEDDDLMGVDSPIPIGADESLVHMGEYDEVAPLYDVINIKLDKCGGLTEGIELARRARADGKSVMVGNMTGSSLSMAPSYVIGQWCEFVDIDGPVLLAQDIEDGLTYEAGGKVSIPRPELWG